MKIEWLIADETVVGSLDRAERDVGPPARAKRDIFLVILDVFWPIQATFMAGNPLCDVRFPL